MSVMRKSVEVYIRDSQPIRVSYEAGRRAVQHATTVDIEYQIQAGGEVLSLSHIEFRAICELLQDWWKSENE